STSVIMKTWAMKGAFTEKEVTFQWISKDSANNMRSLSVQSLATWGVALGVTALFVLEPTPIARRDILQNIPVIGGYWKNKLEAAEPLKLESEDIYKMPLREEPADSMGTTVKDLAAENAREFKESKIPAVPIYLVVFFLVVIALGIVTLPLGLIVTSSSQDSLSDLSSPVTRQAVDGIYNQIQNTIDEPSKLSTGPYGYEGQFDPSTRTFMGDKPFYNLAAIIAARVNPYVHMMKYPNSQDYEYMYGYANWLTSTSTASIQIPSLTPNHVTYACGVGFDNRISLDPLLTSIKVTEETHCSAYDVYLYEPLRPHSSSYPVYA
ncbi:hypothetical protein HDU76_006888, partial [Blyttiomyces sp. JEL0837]